MSNYVSKMHQGLKDKEKVTSQDLNNMIESLEHFYVATSTQRVFHEDIQNEYKEKCKKLCEYNSMLE